MPLPLLTGVVGIGLAVGSLLALQVPATAQDDQMSLASQAFASRQRAPVAFPHAAHAERSDCTVCHHVYENGQNVWDPSQPSACAHCHKPSGSRLLPNLAAAFHKSCLACHKQTPPRDGKRPPVLCADCHRH